MGIYITVDVGAGRTGIPVGDELSVRSSIQAVVSSQKHRCHGILSHAGQTYGARGTAQIKEIHQNALRSLRDLKRNVLDDFGLEVSYGDTPSCSIAEDWIGIDEIRPGNFVFYDLMQLQIGSCTPSQIAVAVACPVVALHPHRNECIVYGGAIHFGRDSIQIDNEACFGRVVVTDGHGQWGDYNVIGSVVRLSQEHGVVRFDDNIVSRIKIGDTLTVLPVHSCMTAQYIGGYKTIEGRSIDHIARSYLTPV